MDKIKLKKHLTDKLLPFWNGLCDYTNGGFYGYVNEFLDPDKKSDKSLILSSRILWFYSAAYELLEDERLLEYAKHAYLFIAKNFYDEVNGGFYWSVTYNGLPSDMTKHTHSQAYVIYALSKLYEVSGDEGALSFAVEMYELIETKCSNDEGYLESFSCDFVPENNDKLSSNGIVADRTMNTVIHLMEAYTELYRVSGIADVKKSLLRIIDIIENKIFNKEKSCLNTYFDMGYNTIIDLDSFGHDIEAAWLLDRCAEVLDDKETSKRIFSMSDILRKHVLDTGYDAQKGAVYNYVEDGRIDKQYIWWVQAEAVVGFYSAWMRDKAHNEYLLAAEKISDFISQKMVDPRCGEWYELIKEDGTVDISRGMVHTWKCPYHTGRMYIELVNQK